MDIRPIRAGEAEQFLRLLCDTFDLDFARAHRVFFAEPLFDLNRKWAAFEGSEMVSILTTVGLEFGWGKAIGIAGVATRKDVQRRGYAARLLDQVLTCAASAGETGALLFAKNPSLYSKCGFEVRDEVLRGPIQTSPEREPFELLEFNDVQERYNRWSLQDPNRLVRDDRRWGYWRWNLRVCTAVGDGYICTEAGVVREIVADKPIRDWSLPAGTEWLGLRSMADRLAVPLRGAQHDLHLMVRNVPGQPQMFMTDQF